MMVKCPTCSTDVPWSRDQAFRPFCSERCKLIDLGAWASERYSIAGRTDAPAAGRNAAVPDGD